MPCWESFAEGSRGALRPWISLTPVGSAFDQVYITTLLAWLHVWRGDFATALPLSDRALRIAESHNRVVPLPTVMTVHGRLLCDVGRAADGISLMRSAIEMAESSRLMYRFTYWIGWLAEGYQVVGDITQSSQAALRGLELARRRQEPGLESWFHCLLGDIKATTLSESVAAERSYLDALTAAESLRLRPTMARCHLGLGKFTCVRGRSNRPTNTWVWQRRCIARWT
jgi:hypothetical protein